MTVAVVGAVLDVGKTALYVINIMKEACIYTNIYTYTERKEYIPTIYIYISFYVLFSSCPLLYRFNVRQQR